MHRIEPQQPLPPVERRFDYITAFAICFHELEKNGEWTGRWERKDWLFFLDDIAENYIAPGGRMYLFFNDWPHGDFNEVKSRIFPCRYNVRVGHKCLISVSTDRGYFFQPSPTALPEAHAQCRL